ncbi:SpoIIE family protein phosphatase [Streptomyces sp. PanSC19]|uniref:ATP-binding SpoIIE family protein phosphatase n=1 Tax=Streptomyces sp. PanSC19 TaxID=1520455 RepID=UPI00288949AB|nr:SpoIIE family protein phosphatase [Streptomyces sp. PanSC19]
MSRLLRAYRLGHLSLLEPLQAEAPRLTGDWHVIHLASMRLVTIGFDHVDRSSEEVVAAYQEEHDRLLQRRLALTDRASKRIGTTLGVTRTAEELTEVCTEDFADLVTVDLFDAVLDETGMGSAEALTQRRVAQRSVLDGCPESLLRIDEAHSSPDASEPVRALTTGRPVLHHIAGTEMPTWMAPSESHGRVLRALGLHSVLLVPLHARGAPWAWCSSCASAPRPPSTTTISCWRGRSSPGQRWPSTTRRYTRERSTALTLQRTLLPRHTVRQSAVETASRHLPAGSRTGVGGDWHDVIPLSGARVALVVGDVVGRGLHAAATMGRLHTAVRAFADIDLMPDVLPTHLDDVVVRMQREESRDGGETSATCLYATYDPVSRRCSLASAGHVPPTVVIPSTTGAATPASGVVEWPEVPIGPPLGLGGLPFETGGFELREGSLLVLHTDGLIAADRTRDVDLSLTTLHGVLASAPEPLEETCDRLPAVLLPSRPADDVAPLVARTRALDPDHVATMDLPSGPAAVSGARGFASDGLTAWGLEELSFTTELVVGELVTNAIRYGKSPVRLRLVLQTTLTCEVSDAGSTAPHLRRARIFDEGGRGLLLVAQLTEHWGARHNREGKVIWAEQALPAAGGPTAEGTSPRLEPT